VKQWRFGAALPPDVRKGWALAWDLDIFENGSRCPQRRWYPVIAAEDSGSHLHLCAFQDRYL